MLALLTALRIEPLSKPLAVQVDVFPPDRRRRDIDNLQKALLDALQHGGAYLDDSQVARLVIERHEPVEGGKAVVEIRNR